MARPRKTDGDLRHGRRCVFALHAHLVFVTKFRRNVFKSEHLEAMQAILAGVCKDFEAELVEFNGEHDHVHLLIAQVHRGTANTPLGRPWRPRSGPRNESRGFPRIGVIEHADCLGRHRKVNATPCNQLKQIARQQIDVGIRFRANRAICAPPCFAV